MILGQRQPTKHWRTTQTWSKQQTLFHDKNFPLRSPWLLVNSLTFPGFPKQAPTQRNAERTSLRVPGGRRSCSKYCRCYAGQSTHAVAETHLPCCQNLSHLRLSSLEDWALAHALWLLVHDSLTTNHCAPAACTSKHSNCSLVQYCSPVGYSDAYKALACWSVAVHHSSTMHLQPAHY